MKCREQRKDRTAADKPHQRGMLAVKHCKRQSHKTRKTDVVQNHPMIVRITRFTRNKHYGIDSGKNNAEHAVGNNDITENDPRIMRRFLRFEQPQNAVKQNTGNHNN